MLLLEFYHIFMIFDVFNTCDFLLILAFKIKCFLFWDIWGWTPFWPLFIISIRFFYIRSRTSSANILPNRILGDISYIILLIPIVILSIKILFKLNIITTMNLGCLFNKFYLLMNTFYVYFFLKACVLIRSILFVFVCLTKYCFPRASPYKTLGNFVTKLTKSCIYDNWKKTRFPQLKLVI